MLKLLIYTCCSGVFASRRIAKRIHEDVAFRVLAAGHFPGFRSIGRLRKGHIEAFQDLFVQVVWIAVDDEEQVIVAAEVTQESSDIRQLLPVLDAPSDNVGSEAIRQTKAQGRAPFGWINRCMGFRSFSLRGVANVRSEFALVCLSMNLRRLAEKTAW